MRNVFKHYFIKVTYEELALLFVKKVFELPLLFLKPIQGLTQFFSSSFACEIHFYFYQAVVHGTEKEDYVHVVLSAND